MPTHSLYLITNIPTTTPDIPNFLAEGGDTSIKMTFSPNGDGGSMITSYEYSTDNFISDINTIGISSPYTITGLQDGTTYNIELRAVNKNGYGTKTDSPDITPSGKPSAPTINSITTLDRSAQIYFTAGNNNGAVIQYYILTYSSNEFVFSSTPIQITANPYTILETPLTNGTSYKIKLIAHNGNGDSTPTISDSFIPSGIPYPVNVNSITPLDRSAIIAFTAPNNNGAAIQYYILTYSSNNFVTNTIISNIPTNASPYTIPGTPLTNGITYQIKFQAHNKNGDSEAYIIPQSFTPATTPSAPIFSVASGNGIATLSNFVTTDNGGSSIINYQYSTNNGLTFIAFNPAQTTGNYVITGLTNGQTYQIQMKAVNGVGAGQPSAAQPVTPVSVAPTDYSMYFPFNTDVTDAKNSLNTSPNFVISNTTKVVGTGGLNLTTASPNALTTSPYNNSYPAISRTGLFTDSFNSTATSYSICFWLNIPILKTAANGASVHDMYWNISQGQTKGINLSRATSDACLTGVGGTAGPSPTGIGMTIYTTGVFKGVPIIDPIVVDTWYHVVLIFTNNGQNLKVYNNGSLSGTFSNLPQSFNNTTTYNVISFGTQTGNITLHPSCYLDDFRVYNRVLTDAEITAVYNYR